MYFSASMAASARVRLACSRPLASYLVKRRMPARSIVRVSPGRRPTYSGAMEIPRTPFLRLRHVTAKPLSSDRTLSDVNL